MKGTGSAVTQLYYCGFIYTGLCPITLIHPLNRIQLTTLVGLYIHIYTIGLHLYWNRDLNR